MAWKFTVLAMALGCLIGCSSENDIILTVQETNVDTKPSCDGHQDTVTAVRSCDQVAVSFWVCSPHRMCDEQLEELVNAIEACEIDDNEMEQTWAPTTDC